ncbi:type I secretion system permease/ATPase [Bosea sp. NBC_00550]|uniref:type I secretion system permease/ATPase n=1 Tax=Bosea sp. NBC_00550 TaxID=2969621 RepID=UPI00222F9B3C|nr:type I secretion system permease/ATPase [Bosea sp. NBC_00550]UZF93476.1 type I secretion system permease/ATPase [Bosea sp. NBC_00550]
MASSARLTEARKRDGAVLTRDFRQVALFLFLISGLINILALTGSFYMLQVYDRALTSGSVQTLAALSVLAIGLYLFQGGFDIVRSQVLIRIGARLDEDIAPLAHRVALDMPRFGFSSTEALERGRDVDTVRGFLGSQGPATLFDLPWIPLYLAFVYFLHPWLGALTLGGAVVLSLLTLLSEILARRLSSSSRQAAIARNAMADTHARNAEVVRAMGFSGRAVARFDRVNREHLALQTSASDLGGTFGAVARVLRMILQSATLGLGAFLTIKGELSAGAIIAASVASARALAPVDQAIGNWKSFVAARLAFGRLRETVVALSKAVEPMELPAPHRSLGVDRITVAAPGSGQVLLSEVSFELTAGKALGIIGVSGGGKTTLVRALTGIWPCLRGSVRLDGANLEQWPEDAIGRHLGYLPQEVSLLDASIGDNISRLAPDLDPAAIVAAATAAGIHDMIVKLPEGYQTQLGPQGTALSAGQRQRIGLARALYGNPFLVVLDEPNSNLDSEGEAALTRAIEGIKARGGIAIIVAHRPSALVAVDLLGVVQGGKLTGFGPRDTILNPVQKQPAPAGTDVPVEPRLPAASGIDGGAGPLRRVTA